jgi:hypothetical protein
MIVNRRAELTVLHCGREEKFTVPSLVTDIGVIGVYVRVFRQITESGSVEYLEIRKVK